MIEGRDFSEGWGEEIQATGGEHEKADNTACYDKHLAGKSRMMVEKIFPGNLER
jgi:hypothetical protein